MDIPFRGEDSPLSRRLRALGLDYQDEALRSCNAAGGEAVVISV